MPERLGGSPIEGTLISKEAQPSLHPLQLFAIEADYARSFFDSSKKNAKQQLPWLIQKNPAMSKSDIKSRHILGLYDAYSARQQGAEGLRQFRLDWGDTSDYLLGQVDSFLPELDKKRVEAIEHPEKIQPYDVHLAERRARRALANLPKDKQPLFAEMSGVEVEKRWQRYAERTASVGLSTASMVGADAAAGAVGTPVEKAHFHLLESTNIGLLIAAEVASYGLLFYGITKHVRANRRLAREANVTMNPGYTVGKAAAESVGATEKTIEKTSTISQFGVEFTKDTVWNVAIGTAVAAGQLTIRDALILSTFANLGGTAYELGVAAGAHGFLKARRMVYNNRHPFFLDEEEISSNVGAFEEIARTDVRADLAV